MPHQIHRCSSSSSLLTTLLVIGIVALGVVACGGSDDTTSSKLRARQAGSNAPPDSGAAPGASSTQPNSAAPSKGCNGAAAKPGTSGLSANVAITVGDDGRTYDLSVPTGYDPTHAYPIVFVFHGGGGSSESARKTFDFENIAGDKAVFVYPQGEGDWDLDDPADQNRDVAFFDQMLSSLESSLCIDSTRVFATGSSNGAYQANQLGCRRGGKIRALASHAGGGPFENDDGYDDDGNLKCNGPPPAVLIVHGDADDTVDLSEGQKSVAHWKWANHCSDDSTPHSPDPCVAYTNCKVPVVWCEIPGMNHGVWEKGPQATWDFFARF